MLNDKVKGFHIAMNFCICIAALLQDRGVSRLIVVKGAGPFLYPVQRLSLAVATKEIDKCDASLLQVCQDQSRNLGMPAKMTILCGGSLGPGHEGRYSRSDSLTQSSLPSQAATIHSTRSAISDAFVYEHFDKDCLTVHSSFSTGLPSRVTAMAVAASALWKTPYDWLSGVFQARSASSFAVFLTLVVRLQRPTFANASWTRAFTQAVCNSDATASS